MLELDEACGGLLRALRVDGDHRDITSPIFAPSTVTPSKRFRPTWTSTFIVGCPLWGNQLFCYTELQLWLNWRSEGSDRQLENPLNDQTGILVLSLERYLQSFTQEPQHRHLGDSASFPVAASSKVLDIKVPETPARYHW